MLLLRGKWTVPVLFIDRASPISAVNISEDKKEVTENTLVILIAKHTKNPLNRIACITKSSDREMIHIKSF